MTARGDIQLPARGRTRGEREQQKLAQRQPPPHAPLATSVRLEPGGRAEIVLRADGGGGHNVDFILRSPPSHGGFEGPPRRLDRNRVALTYVHRGADGPGRDAFTFAAQAPGTAVSAAELVSIEVSDPAPPPGGPSAAGAPDLAATPADLDFGAVEAGRATGVTLTLENRGGGEAVGQLDPPVPWAVEGDGAYRVAPGGRQAFRVVFRPTREGSFAETLRVDVVGGGRTAGCVVRLVGTGLAASPAAPAQVAVAAPTPGQVVPAAAAVVPAVPAPVALPPAAVQGEAAPHALPGVAEPDSFVANEAGVTAVVVQAVGTTTLELAWPPPTPLPASYRVERRSFASDDREDGGVRIDWSLCERVDLRVHANEVTATLRGLTPGEPVTLRVVAVDTAGRLAPPSPAVDAATAGGSTWWRPTPLKVLGLALAVCLGLIARRRWQERQLLRELDTRHDTSDEPALFVSPTADHGSHRAGSGSS